MACQTGRLPQWATLVLQIILALFWSIWWHLQCLHGHFFSYIAVLLQLEQNIFQLFYTEGNKSSNDHVIYILENQDVNKNYIRDILENSLHEKWNVQKMYYQNLTFKWATRKNPPTFHYTGWFIGILIFGLLTSPYTWVGSHPLYITQTTRFFFHCSNVLKSTRHTSPPPQTCTRPTSVDSKLFEKRKVKPFAGEEKTWPRNQVTRWFDCVVSLDVGNFGENLFHQGFQTVFSKKRVCDLKNPGWKGKLSTGFLPGKSSPLPKFWWVFPTPMWWI